MKAILSVLSTLVIVVSASNAFAARIDSGNAAELAAHRIEKLVLLKKLPEAYQKNFKGLEVQQVLPGGVSKPSFEVVAFQETDDGEEANKVTVVLDEKGKALSHTITNGKSATQPTTWADKDPLTLSELAVHHIEHMMSSDKKLPPFYEGMKALRISQMQHGTQTMVVVEFVSELVPEKLELMLKTNGDFISYQIK